MQPLAHSHTRLYLKVQWPYINRSYAPPKRLELVKNHYDFVLKNFSKDLLDYFFSHKFLYLAKWNLGELGAFSLRLSHENACGQEGEMILSLHQEKSDRLLALFFFSITGDSEISIGCLQGGKPMLDPGEMSNKDLTVAVTRQMYGLRPKNLLLFALRHLAAQWGITRIRAVSMEVQLWEMNVQADYNSFWVEVGGTLAADGMYDLSCESSYKDLQEVKPNKRSMYRKRYHFMEALEREMEGALASPYRKLEILEPDSAPRNQIEQAQQPKG